MQRSENTHEIIQLEARISPLFKEIKSSVNAKAQILVYQSFYFNLSPLRYNSSTVLSYDSNHLCTSDWVQSSTSRNALLWFEFSSVCNMLWSLAMCWIVFQKSNEHFRGLIYRLLEPSRVYVPKSYIYSQSTCMY